MFERRDSIHVSISIADGPTRNNAERRVDDLRQPQDRLDDRHDGDDDDLAPLRSHRRLRVGDHEK